LRISQQSTWFSSYEDAAIVIVTKIKI